MGDTNIASFVDAPAAGAPERPALITDDGAVCTYADLASEAAAWASTLAEAGVGEGSRVALVDWGGVRSTAVTLAAARLGGATVQINPLLTTAEQHALNELAGCGPVRVGDGSLDHPIADRPTADRPTAEHPTAGIPPPLAPGGATTALVLFTSGTTGLPKAVPISHAAIRARVGAYRAPFDAGRPPAVSLMCMPSFHVGGMLGLLLGLYAGDTVVIQPRFDAGRWIELVERHRVASAMVVPTMLARILDHPSIRAADLSSLAMISYGAAVAPVELVERAMDALPSCGFANVFGQTETLGAYTTLTPADHHDRWRIGSVGRAMPGVELRIGDAGELWVRTPVTDGWIQTGDLARIDGDGYVYPSGRLSDTINRGGEKFSPAPILDAVRSHPAVLEAAVAGVPDPEMGERVGVVFVTRGDAAPPTRDELREWCRPHIAAFKLPDLVVAVDQLPYNELGKLPRKDVAKLIKERA